MLKNLGRKPAVCLSACRAAALLWSHELCTFARIPALSAQTSFSTVIRSASGTASCILCSALKYFFSTADSQCSATWRVRRQHGDQQNRSPLQLWPCWAQEPCSSMLALFAPLLIDQLRTSPHPRLTQTLLPRVKLVKLTDSSYLKTWMTKWLMNASLSRIQESRLKVWKPLCALTLTYLPLFPVLFHI